MSAPHFGRHELGCSSRPLPGGSKGYGEWIMPLPRLDDDPTSFHSSFAPTRCCQVRPPQYTLETQVAHERQARAHLRDLRLARGRVRHVDQRAARGGPLALAQGLLHLHFLRPCLQRGSDTSGREARDPTRACGQWRSRSQIDTSTFLQAGGTGYIHHVQSKTELTLFVRHRVVRWHQHHEEDGRRRLAGFRRKRREMGWRGARRIRTATIASRPTGAGANTKLTGLEDEVHDAF